MAKFKQPAADDEFDDDFSTGTSVDTDKLPVQLNTGIMPLDDFFKIPCDALIPYRDKQDSDFAPYTQAQLEHMAETIRTGGVIEPITVRPLEDDPTRFEILAGEQRWRASQLAKQESIPAHILRYCNNAQAKLVFSVTNVLRRENSIRDKINGWWHYTQITKYMRQSELELLVEQKAIPPEIIQIAQDKKRQISRYAKCHQLIPELLDLVDAKKIAVNDIAEVYAELTQEQQFDLLTYKQMLNNKDTAKALKELAESGHWDTTELQNIVGNPKKEVLSSYKVNKVIKDKIPKDLYYDAPRILTEALKLYFEKYPIS